MRLERVSNIHIQDYLYENGLEPVKEDLLGVAFYKPCRKFYLLLDKYYIKYTCIPNKNF